MKKTYLILSALAALITLAHLIYWADALGFMLGTLFIIGIPILFWFPLSIISFVWAIFLKEENKKLKAVLLGIPIITLFLFYTIGEYYGP